MANRQSLGGLVSKSPCRHQQRSTIPPSELTDGAIYVITPDRDPAVNIRTQFLRILAKAGIEPWPKLFQNLRSSRQTELTETWPAHIVCAWMGNSKIVARDHHLQPTDEHFAMAAGGEG